MHKLNSVARGFTLIETVVALSVLALGVAGIAQLRHTAYRHITVTQEVQEASYFANTHLAALSSNDASSKAAAGVQSGEYPRGSEANPYPWTLTLTPLDEKALQPELLSLSTKVRPLNASLSVWVDQGVRELRFHTLLLLDPIEQKESAQPKPELRLTK